MSVQASAWAWNVRGLPTHLKLTLLAVADACNAEGYGYPGQMRLAAQVDCTDRQVRRNLKELQTLGLLQVVIRPGKGHGRSSNAYQLNLAQIQANAAPGNRTCEAEATGHVGQGQPDLWDQGNRTCGVGATGHVGQGNRTCGVGQPDIAMSYEPLVEPSEKNNKSLCAARTAGRAAMAGEPGEPGEPPGFARFWATWPTGQRKRGRKAALAAWRALRLESQAAAIVADVENRRDHDDFWLRGYAPMPQTYLRGARWEDELTQAPPQRSDSPTMRGILALEDLKWAPPLRPGLPA